VLDKTVMSARTWLLVAALAAACSSGSPTQPRPSPPPGGSGGSGAAGSGGSAGTGGAAGGSGGEGGAPPADAAPVPEKDASPTVAPDLGVSAEVGPAVSGGAALMVVGKGPLIGDDLQIQKVLQDKGLKVETVEDAVATAASAQGKRVVILSYSLDSDLFKNKAEFVDVPVPLIVMEHALLGTLGMANNHKWAEPVTQITITGPDSPLAAGLPMGDVTVYGKTGEVFWGVPGPGALKVATVKGNANQWVIFAYPTGAMMMTRPAPAKRLQFFLGAHQVPTQFLNDKGLQLLGASIAWSIQ
jgi:hypothetical protein